jgi:drug/metabolite transporter (DMT)-like permease
VLIPVVVGLASGDRPSAIEVMGIAFAVAGLLLISYQPRQARAHGQAIAVGVGMAVIAALGFGGFYVLMDEASGRGDIVSAVLINRGAVFTMLASGAVVFGIRPSSLAPSHWRDLTLVGFLAASATLLFAGATTEGLLSLVAVVGSLYPVATILLARFVLGERLRRPQRLGAMAALVGVAMIAA